MKKTKRKPSIKKYATGGSAADPYRKEDGTIDYNAKYNPDAGQYAATGTATVAGGTNIGRVYSQPNATMADKYNANSGAATGIVSSISPLYGGLTAATYKVAAPIKKGLEVSNEDGTLKHPGLAKAGVLVNSFVTDPLSSVSTNVSNGIWSPTQYTNKLEEENKQKIAQEHMQTYSKGGKHRPKLLQPRFVSPQPGSQMYGTDIPQFPNGGIPPDDEYQNRDYGYETSPGGEQDVNNYSPNAELEKKEVFQTPNGQIDNVNGSSHENGGVDVNIPEGTQILSDRLKMPGTKKTFSDLGKQYVTSKEDKVLSDDKVSSTKKSTAELIKGIKNQKLQELFNAQESLKQSKVQNYAKKLGLVSDENPEYLGGGIHIKKSHEGRFTAYKERTGKTTEEALHSSNPHVRQMANFARNAKKWHHAMGGTQPPYDENYVQPTSPEGWNSEPIQYPYNPDYTEKKPFYPTPNGEQVPNNYVEVPKGYTKPNYVPADPNRPKTFDYNQIGDIASGVAQNAGNIYDLAQTNFGHKYDKENSGQLTPKLPNYSQSYKNLRDSYYANKKDINQIAGGNAALSIANLQRNKTGYNKDFATLNEQVENSRVPIENQFALHNQGIRMQDRANEQQNKARSEDIAREAVSRIGSNSANAYRDYKAGKMDQNSASLISSMFKNYKLDMNNPQHWEWIYQQINKGK